MPTLCAPTPEVICFGCCPPIRPPGYDHLDHVRSLRRELAENRRRFMREEPRYRPIVGFHCWALGFLDKNGRRAGCLLHPMQNQGADLRFLIDYGDKCKRESCVPAQMFARLPREGRRFWLPLVDGLSAFYFSSPRANPLFHLMLWGPRVLEALRLQARERGWTVTELLWRAPFLTSSQWSPKGDRFLFRLALERLPRHPSFFGVEAFCRFLRPRLSAMASAMLSAGDAFQQSHVHFLPLEGDFLDYLRLGLGRRRLSEPLARRFKEAAEHLAEEAASEKAAPGLEVQTEESADRGGKEGSQRTTRNLELNGGKG